MFTLSDYLQIGRRWTKNGMDRIYFNLDDIFSKEHDEVPVRNYFNRYERQNLKVFYDINKDALILTVGSNTAVEAVKDAIRQLINK